MANEPTISKSRIRNSPVLGVAAAVPAAATVLRCVEEGWQRARLSADDYYLDAVALNLHGFYGGLERIFERIATVVDGARPSGEHWHQALLRQMAEEMPGVRPAVISEAPTSFSTRIVVFATWPETSILST
ncbi:MAG: hypothetical protein NTZ17_04625 [Phycisphaerae bacterium]|nr:hypothetical protein [Phycisphaerae bacterium]